MKATFWINILIPHISNSMLGAGAPRMVHACNCFVQPLLLSQWETIPGFWVRESRGTKNNTQAKEILTILVLFKCSLIHSLEMICTFLSPQDQGQWILIFVIIHEIIIVVCKINFIHCNTRVEQWIVFFWTLSQQSNWKYKMEAGSFVYKYKRNRPPSVPGNKNHMICCTYESHLLPLLKTLSVIGHFFKLT